MPTIQNTNDLLGYFVQQSEIRRDWFGFTQQKMTGIKLCHEIAAIHADVMSPDEIVKFVMELNHLIYKQIISRKDHEHI